MVINDLPLPNAGPRRICFAHASSLLLAQALTDANERLARHFPTLSGFTWGDALRQLQPDLLVNGKSVTFDWPGLARRVHGLAASAEWPAPDPPTDEPSAAELAGQFRAYRRQAVPDLAELHESPRARGLLAYALLTQLAHGHALAERLDDAVQEAPQHPGDDAGPLALEQFVPSPGPAGETADSREEGRGEADAVPPLTLLRPNNPLGRVPRRNGSKRRTFRDIAEHHPRGNGKFGFTVRELCATMRISAASLTEARDNPGRLSVNKVVALAGAMGESPLQVLVDLVAEAGTKNQKKRGKRVIL